MIECILKWGVAITLTQGVFLRRKVMNATKRVTLLCMLIMLCLISAPSFSEVHVTCKKCGDTGRILSKKYPVPYPYYCSSSLDPKRDFDAGWHLCDKCKGKKHYIEAARELQDWLDSLQAWTGSRQNAIDKKIFGKQWEKHRTIHIETPHWVFATNLAGRRMKTFCLPYPLPKWLAHQLKAEKLSKRQVKRLKFNADDDLTARVYAERLEYLYWFFIQTFEKDLIEGFEEEEESVEDEWEPDEIDEEDEEEAEEEVEDFEIEKCGVGGGKYGYYIWRTGPEQSAASHFLCGNTSPEGVTLYAPWSLHTQQDKNRGDDEQLIHQVVHTGTMVIVSDYLKYERDAVPNWFDEALGHWMEYELLGDARVCTRQELDFEIVIPRKGLRGRVYKMIKEKTYEPFAAFFGLDHDKLTSKQRVQGFSVVDYMVKNPKNMREWLAHVKDHKDQARAFRDIYGVSMSEFEDSWVEWVKENYKHAMH